MRRVVLVGLLLLSSTARADVRVARPDGSSWTWETAYPNAGGSENHSVSMALDSNDDPHISFYDRTASQQRALWYTRQVGSSWQSTQIDNNATESSYGTSLKLTSGGEPRISYIRTGSNTEELRYASLTGATWTTELADGSPRVGHYSSLALDASDNPHISYFNFANGDLKLAVKSGSWSTSTIDSAGLTGEGTSIALFNGTERVAYNTVGVNPDLRFANRSSGSWSLQTVDSAAKVGGANSLALDALGNPRIAYWDLDTGVNTNLKFAEWNPSTASWNTFVVDSGTSTGFGNSLVLGPDGTPHISYFYAAPGTRQIRYATRNSAGIWTTQTVDVGIIAGGSTSISLDSKGLPVIAYSTGVPESSTLVLVGLGVILLSLVRRVNLLRAPGAAGFAGATSELACCRP